jgi:hypothetical protein
MSALLFIQERRKSQERIDFVSQIRIAQHGDKHSYEKQLERWAKDAEIRLSFED